MDLIFLVRLIWHVLKTTATPITNHTTGPQAKLTKQNCCLKLSAQKQIRCVFLLLADPGKDCVVLQSKNTSEWGLSSAASEWGLSSANTGQISFTRTHKHKHTHTHKHKHTHTHKHKHTHTQMHTHHLYSVRMTNSNRRTFFDFLSCATGWRLRALSWCSWLHPSQWLLIKRCPYLATRNRLITGQ